MKKLFNSIFTPLIMSLAKPFLSKFKGQYYATLDARCDEIKRDMARVMPGNMALRGYKCYSSFEEDGIIEAIFKVIGPTNKTFFEIGCGNGIENNTHFLLLNNWKGVWVDGNSGFVQSITAALGGDNFPKLLVKNCFVTKDNCLQLFQEAYTHFNITEIDFFSLDIDSFDFYVMEDIFLAGIRPKVVCVEYNAKWGMYSTVKVGYNTNFSWKGDDYMGVSLGAWNALLTDSGYTLVCCDITGTNAFFVHNNYSHLFEIYGIEQLYQPARYYLAKRISGHMSSLKMLKDVVGG